MAPSSTKTIDQEFSNEHSWKLSAGYKGKVKVLVSSQIFHIHLASQVKEIIHNPEKYK